MKKDLSRKRDVDSARRLTACVARFAGRRAVVVGDLILDRYVWGDASRISPEAPTPVVRVKEETLGLGGAGNVAANLAALGVRPNVIGVIGRDEAGDRMRELLRGLGAGASGIIVDPSRPTTRKDRVMAKGQQLMRIDHEETAPVGREIAARVLKFYENQLAGAEVVILSDYAKGLLSDELCRALIEAARRAGVPVVVDPKGVDFSKYRGATAITPNRAEVERATNTTAESEEALAAAAAILRRKARARAIVVTRGGEGATVYERNRKPEQIPAQARAVYDVTGAGDSFIAAMSAALGAGASIADAARIGNAAGSIVVGKLGAATAEPRELLAMLHPEAAEHKRRDARQLARDLKAFRASGRKVAFTNGCFDLIHLGHIKFLEAARRQGDALIVAINSDASVRRIKGAPRPVLREEERAALLAALDFVDYVVIFEEDTPDRVLEILRPDVLVKGKALKLKDVVGREFVERAGGRVITLPQFGDVVADTMLEKIARQSAG